MSTTSPGAGRALGRPPTAPALGSERGSTNDAPAGADAAERYVTDVRIRWSDLDAFGHVNNARTLTLLEEARADWLFVEAKQHGVLRLTDGIVVAHVECSYRRSIGYGVPVVATMWVAELGYASFTVAYELAVEGVLAVDASTVLVPVDPATFKPRRLDAIERGYLARFAPAAPMRRPRRR